MEDILNATLSAGVSLGCSCDMINHIWVSILVGFVIGIVSVIGFRFITPKLNNAIHDTCGVLNVNYNYCLHLYIYIYIHIHLYFNLFIYIFIYFFSKPNNNFTKLY